MVKRFLLTGIFVFLLSSAVWADTTVRYRAKSENQGSSIYFDCFSVEDTYYFSVRDIALLLNNTEHSFSLSTDSDGTVLIEKNQGYGETGTEFNSSIGKKKRKYDTSVFNVKCGDVLYSLNSYYINNRNYVKLRDICNIIDINTQWNSENKTIELWYYNDEGEKITAAEIAVLPAVIVDKSKPMVALTFDDGPSVNTKRILDTLEKYNGVATFFVTGNNASKYTDILKRIIDEESQIGNHTYDHLRLTKLSSEGIRSQVNRIQEIVYSATGVYPTVLRPPYGEYNSFVKSNVSIKMLNWNVDTLDWKTRNAESTYNEVMNTLADGNVILMHDLYSQTADAVEKIVPAIVEKGYQLVTVDQLFYAKDNVKGRIK